MASPPYFSSSSSSSPSSSRRRLDAPPPPGRSLLETAFGFGDVCRRVTDFLPARARTALARTSQAFTVLVPTTRPPPPLELLPVLGSEEKVLRLVAEFLPGGALAMLVRVNHASTRLLPLNSLAPYDIALAYDRETGTIWNYWLFLTHNACLTLRYVWSQRLHGAVLSLAVQPRVLSVTVGPGYTKFNGLTGIDELRLKFVGRPGISHGLIVRPESETRPQLLHDLEGHERRRRVESDSDTDDTVELRDDDDDHDDGRVQKVVVVVPDTLNAFFLRGGYKELVVEGNSFKRSGIGPDPTSGGGMASDNNVTDIYFTTACEELRTFYLSGMPNLVYFGGPPEEVTNSFMGGLVELNLIDLPLLELPTLELPVTMQELYFQNCPLLGRIADVPGRMRRFILDGCMGLTGFVVVGHVEEVAKIRHVPGVVCIESANRLIHVISDHSGGVKFTGPSYPRALEMKCEIDSGSPYGWHLIVPDTRDPQAPVSVRLIQMTFHGDTLQHGIICTPIEKIVILSCTGTVEIPSTCDFLEVASSNWAGGRLKLCIASRDTTIGYTKIRCRSCGYTRFGDTHSNVLSGCAHIEIVLLLGGYPAATTLVSHS